jgi:hypothetical protein
MTTPARRAFVLFLSLLAASMTLRTAEARVEQASPPIEAVWMPQKLTFQYRADGIMFSCSSLRQKVERVLLKIGARARTMVRSFDCSELTNIVRVDISLESPVEATDENVRRITDFTTHEELIARVRGEKLPTAGDLERFPAVWKEISLGKDSRIGLTRGDCALLQQLRTYVLPRLSVRIVKDDQHCSAAFGRGSVPRLTVMALVPQTSPDAVLALRGDATARPEEYR